MKSLLLIFALALAARADDWPQFRGPNGIGVAEGRAPVHFGPTTNLLWKTALPSGLSSPCIVGGRIFLTGVEKGALQTLSRNLANAHTTTGVRINHFNVGWVLTKNEYELKLREGHPKDWPEKLPVAFAPSGRIQSPAEIADFALFFCSDEAGIVSGAATPGAGARVPPDRRTRPPSNRWPGSSRRGRFRTRGAGSRPPTSRAAS